jgi:outer membrane receptor protein involved in Fe transport
MNAVGNNRRIAMTVAALIASAAISGPAPARADEPEGASLEAALGELAARSGLQIIYRTEATRGLKAKAVPPGLDAQQELQILLRDTGLQVEQINPHTVTIQRTASSPPQAGGAVKTSWLLAAADGPPQNAVEGSGSVGVTAGTAAHDIQEITEVVVTASRATSDGYVAPTPTTSVGVDELQKSGLTNIADFLNTQVPSFRATVTPTARTLNTSGGGNQLDLRGLGPERTLVLVDGRRHVSTGTSGTLNINVIPQALIERVEVVTGGASAAWGSDAVAGVVNLIFKKNFEGLEGDYHFSESSQGDGIEHRASLLYGTPFASSNGHFTIAGEYVHNEGILQQGSRNWGRQDWQMIANPGYVPGNGQPAQLILPNVHLVAGTPGGIILAPDALAYTQFGPGGAPIVFQPGSVPGFPSQAGGSGVNPGRNNTLLIPETRGVVFARASYQLSDRLSGFAEASYAESTNAWSPLAIWDFGNITIQRDNAFLPPSIGASMDAQHITQFQMGRLDGDFGLLRVDNTEKTLRGVFGVEGSIGIWHWDGYYEAGRDRTTQLVLNNRVTSLFQQSVDAVLDPATGRAVCRSALTDPGNPCVPVNLFGEGSPSKDALSYFHGTSSRITTVKENVLALNVRGEPMSTWAAPIAFAAGAEYRDNRIDVDTDAISARGDFFVNNTTPLSGKIDVKEVYTEAIVPLLRGAPLGHSLDLNGAVRLTDYNTSGRVATWKVGTTYEPLEGLRLRATRSRDIRAPNADELFSAPTSGFATITDPVTHAQDLVKVYTGGNPGLRAETAKTTTFGVVIAPARVSGLQASLDYYRVDLSQAIGSFTGQEVVDRCAAGATTLCSMVQRDAVTQEVTQVNATLVNFSRLKTSGVDFDLGYRFALDSVALGTPGSLTVRILGNHVNELSTDDGVISKDVAGSLGPKLGGVPKWRWTASATYEFGPLTTYLAGRYVGGGKYDKDWGPADINNNNVDSRFYIDASLRYDLRSTDRSRVSLSASVRNLFNKAPPVVPTPDFVATPTNTVYYDVVGRYMSIGLQAAF